jgi:hypothetical protein
MRTKEFRIGQLANLGQVIKTLGKTIRAMSNGSIDNQAGARICASLGIMRACLETQKLEQLEARIDRVVHERTGAARERETQKLEQLGSRPDEIADRVARVRTTIGRERPGNGRERTGTHDEAHRRSN